MSKASLRLPDRFDYSFHRKFLDSYQPVLSDEGTKELVLDFTDVTYVDSAALGMMILIHNKFSSVGKTVKIKGPGGTTLGILTMANMQKYFEFI